MSIIQEAFAKRPQGGPPGTSQLVAPDYSLQFGAGPDKSLQFGSGVPSAPTPADLLEMLIRIISANPTYYPWLRGAIPPDGKSFDLTSTINMPGSGGGAGYSPGPETLVLQLVCPAGYDGLVTAISNNVFGPSFNPALPSLTWRIRNGASLTNSLFVDNYNNITVEFGSTQQPREIAGIFVSSGQSLLYTTTNNDATYPVGPVTQTTCCFHGLFWPSQRGSSNR